MENNQPASSGHPVHRAVYELNDGSPEKCFAVLRSMNNHIKGKGGPQNAHLALMVHDEAHAQFVDAKIPDNLRQIVQELREKEVQLYVCGNTLKRFQVDPSELVEGFGVKYEGAMVAITDLVMDGYVYLRP